MRSFAGGLLARGHVHGDAVGVMSPNVPEYAVVFHGVAFAGGVVSTINPTYTAHEVHQQLVDSGSRLLVTVPAYPQLYGPWDEQLGHHATSVGTCGPRSLSW